MSVFTLKIIALVTMVIDHIGAVFFPELTIIRVIGRISFPIYAFLIAEGFIYTKNRLKYFARLLVFSVISEAVYDILFYRSIFYAGSQNILFELAVGVLVLICTENVIRDKKYIWIIPGLLLVFLSEFFKLSYGIYGIVLILTAYILRNQDILTRAFSLALATVIFNGVTDLSFSVLGIDLDILSTNSIQCFAVFAAVLLAFYSGKKGKGSLKWFFYFIYPAHLAVLAAVRYLLTYCLFLT